MDVIYWSWAEMKICAILSTVRHQPSDSAISFWRAHCSQEFFVDQNSNKTLVFPLKSGFSWIFTWYFLLVMHYAQHKGSGLTWLSWPILNENLNRPTGELPFWPCKQLLTDTDNWENKDHIYGLGRWMLYMKAISLAIVKLPVWTIHKTLKKIYVKLFQSQEMLPVCPGEEHLNPKPNKCSFFLSKRQHSMTHIYAQSTELMLSFHA